MRDSYEGSNYPRPDPVFATEDDGDNYPELKKKPKRDLLFGETIEARFERFKEFAAKYVRDEEGILIDIKKHQKPWFWLVELNMYALLLAPREHGKSTFDKTYILWRICEDPNLRVLIAAHKEELSNEFARFIQSYLELEEIQQRYGFDKGKPWRFGEAYFQSRDGRIYSHPYMTTVAKQAGIAGKRFDIIIMDDILTVDNTRTEKNRRTLEGWINKSLYPALDHPKEGRPIKRKWITIGTRKNLEDWYDKLLQMPHWAKRRDQLYTKDEDGNKTYLWPEKFNEEVEAELRAQMQPDEFAMEYMNEPVAAEGLRFKREWIEPYFWKGKVPVPERFAQYYMGVDPSLGSKKDRSSYAAIAVICFDKRVDHQNIYVVDMIRSKLSLAEQEDIIKATYEKWTINGKEPIMVMEDVLVNKTFAARMKQQLPRMITVDYIHSGLKGTSDVSKIGRIENIFGWLCKRGKVYIKDPTIDVMARTLIEHEYVQFPEGDMDMMDALVLAMDRVDLRTVRTKQPKIWMY